MSKQHGKGRGRIPAELQDAWTGAGGEANADAAVPDATLQTEGRGRPQQPAVADTKCIQGTKGGTNLDDPLTGRSSQTTHAAANTRLSLVLCAADNVGAGQLLLACLDRSGIMACDAYDATFRVKYH